MIRQFIQFVIERNMVHLRRRDGVPWPWSIDPIFQQFRFCNIHRELDKTTIWLAQNWRAPNHDHRYLWFAMAVARRINFVDTLSEIGFPVPWNRERFLKVMHNRKLAGKQLFGGAYMITTGGSTKQWSRYAAEDIFDPLWNNRDSVPNPELGLRDFHTWLCEKRGYGGGFIAAQVVADIKYAGAYQTAKDWFTFASSGPGSKRGLNRVLGRPPKSVFSEKEWHRELLKLQLVLNRTLKEPMHAQDVQNCCCEFDKYERARSGEFAGLQRYRRNGDH